MTSSSKRQVTTKSETPEALNKRYFRRTFTIESRLRQIKTVLRRPCTQEKNINLQKSTLKLNDTDKCLNGERADMATTHEEADNIIVQQAIAVAVAQQQPVTVLADDTDVNPLLLYHYLEQGIQTPMFMESLVKERNVIDIQATVKKHQNIIPAILAGHALTGCDTVAACFGIGKGEMLKVLKTGLNLDMIGNAEANWPEVLEQATQFIASCYGQSKTNSMSEARVSVWTSRTGKSGATVTPKLCSLPPTTEAFIENVKRAHLQTCIWKNALQLDPPDLEPTSYGWIKESRTKSLLPTTVPTNRLGVEWAPSGNLARGMAGLWMLMAFTLCSVYSSNLKAMLIYPRVNLPFNSLEELASLNIPTGLANGSAIHEKIIAGQCTMYTMPRGFLGPTLLSMALPKASPLRSKFDNMYV
ncbi:hypothetical protein GWK47_025151 [Chionoecetes opilio]|uniref:Uncharacterized protein n=1 Tax=Chionoecetes opilio TaxID=41210 RepID=A0A8J5CD72_CHIOP|nr:hypothetical protein GWK47_025151 [Chionoecetes opilio]